MSRRSRANFRTKPAQAGLFPAWTGGCFAGMKFDVKRSFVDRVLGSVLRESPDQSKVRAAPHRPTYLIPKPIFWLFMGPFGRKVWTNGGQTVLNGQNDRQRRTGSGANLKVQGAEAKATRLPPAFAIFGRAKFQVMGRMPNYKYTKPEPGCHGGPGSDRSFVADWLFHPGLLAKCSDMSATVFSPNSSIAGLIRNNSHFLKPLMETGANRRFVIAITGETETA